MVVNFEFLGNEPIENVITCMNYKVDKVVFFGYYNAIMDQNKTTEKFLKKYCSVQSVVFHSLSQNDLQSVLKMMREEIEYELSQNADIYFDITGGESLILVAFGMLSKEYKTPMHMYDINKGEIIELDEGSDRSISGHVAKQEIKMNLDKFIEMRGGVINYALRKEIKDCRDEEFEEDVEEIWNVVKTFPDYWNHFSDFLREKLKPDGSLLVNRRAATIVDALASSTTKLRSVGKLNQIIDALAEADVLLDVVHADGKYRFRYKNEMIMNCLWEGGSILELYTCHQEKKKSDECQVGVHLDWDGVIHSKPGIDVLNEIDVLSLRGYVPTFISCKGGRMTPQNTLHALYELETVTRRFGGKYAKKVLVTTKNLGNVYLERAAEMGIEVR